MVMLIHWLMFGTTAAPVDSSALTSSPFASGWSFAVRSPVSVSVHWHCAPTYTALLLFHLKTVCETETVEAAVFYRPLMSMLIVGYHRPLNKQNITATFLVFSHRAIATAICIIWPVSLKGLFTCHTSGSQWLWAVVMRSAAAAENTRVSNQHR